VILSRIETDDVGKSVDVSNGDAMGAKALPLTSLGISTVASDVKVQVDTLISMSRRAHRPV
jgi:hypothetical protein